MFILGFSGWRESELTEDKHTFHRLVCADGYITETGECNHRAPPRNGRIFIKESELRPDYQYKVAIEMKNYAVELRSDTDYAKFTSKAGLPEKPSFKKATTEVTDIPSSSVTVVLEVENLNEENGVIEWSALLVSQVGCDDEEVVHQKITGYCSELEPCPKSRTWSEVAHADCVKQYRTTNEQWNIVGVGEKDGSPDHNTVYYTIGTDKCPIDKQDYCNGPLKPSTDYNVTLRIFTKNSYRDIHIVIFTTGE